MYEAIGEHARLATGRIAHGWTVFSLRKAMHVYCGTTHDSMEVRCAAYSAMSPSGDARRSLRYPRYVRGGVRPHLEKSLHAVSMSLSGTLDRRVADIRRAYENSKVGGGHRSDERSDFDGWSMQSGWPLLPDGPIDIRKWMRSRNDAQWNSPK